MSNDPHNKNTNKAQGWNVKKAKSVASNNMQGRNNMNPDDFDKLILQQGVRVKIFRSMYCPNVKSVDGAEHDIDCQIPGCNGSGIIDRHPIETITFIQNQQLEKMAFTEGQVDGNSVAGTFLSGIELQYFTLVELMDFTEIYFQRIKRSKTNVDVLKYFCHRVNMIIDQHNIEYYECIDFKIDLNGNINWVANRGPASETIYSIHYEASVQFRAVKSMHSNRFSQVKLKGKIKYVKFPEQWQLSKEYLVKRVDDSGNEIIPNLVREET